MNIKRLTLSSFFLSIVSLSIAQNKVITYQELPTATGATSGSGMFFAATMTSTDITVTFAGPSTKWIALGFGTMMNPTDVLVYSGGKTGATHPVAWKDYFNSAGNATGVNIDATQNWTINSDNVVSGVRTVSATRLLNTGDANDIALSFAATSIDLVWARDAGTSYTITNHGTSNRANGINLPWTVVDITAPTLAASGALSPADNSTGVTLGTNMVMAFNENVTLGTGNISLYQSGGTLIEAFDVAASSNVTASGSSVTINPTNALSSLTDYYITVDATAIKDVAGNFYSGISSNTTWNFTTLDNSSDVTPPALSITPFSPADNATTVPISSVLEVTFNEDIALGATGTISLYLSTGTLVESFDVSSSTQLYITGTTLTITPTLALSYLTSYYVNIESGAITDVALNPYSGFTDNSTWNFTTEMNSSGISESSLLNYIKLNNKLLYVSLEEGTSFNVSVFDMQGKLVSSKINQSPIDLSKEKAGIYLVNIEIGQKQFQTKIILE